MKEKLLVLGSDFNTVNVVNEAKRQGMYVVVADLMESSPTKDLADEAWLISTTNIDLLAQKSIEAGITAVMFGASDFNISQSRKLCKRLSIPIYCDDDTVWNIVRDKRKFKDICKEVGAPVAKDYYLTEALSDDELKEIDYPVVVKPCDKSGNRGMSYCNNNDELRIAWKKAREISNGVILVEKQLHGPEFNVHYVVAEGEMSLLYFSATHHQPGQPENIYSFKYTTTKYLRQYIDEVNEKVIDALKLVGCKEGIVWVDVMRDSDGKFYLLEMGYRFGGVMTYVPYEKVFGFNVINWMLDCARGIRHSKSDLPKSLNEYNTNGVAASYHLFAVKTDKIAQIDGLTEIEEMDGVWVDCPKRLGSEIRSYANSGLIGIYGKDLCDLCEKLKRINALLNIKNNKGEDLIVKYTDINSIV